MTILPDEKDFFWFHMFVKNQVPMLDVMNYIVKNIVPLETKIEARDDEYFKTNAVLFEKLGDFKTEVNRFKMLWDANQNSDDRDVVWKWLECFVGLGKQFSAAQNQQQ
jgi:hypothetical protein